MKTNKQNQRLAHQIITASIKLEEIYSRELSEATSTLEELEFEYFTSDKPYRGDVINKIFLTYCDHYRHNRGEQMSVCKLDSPSVEMDDRGYLEGVALDLSNFIKLRGILEVGISDQSYLLTVAAPKFKLSPRRALYEAQAASMLEEWQLKVSEARVNLQAQIDLMIKNRMGISARYYVRSI